MVKPLLLLAFTANVFILVSSTGKDQVEVFSSSTSNSKSSSNSQSSSSSWASSTDNLDDEYQEVSSSSVASTAVSSSSLGFSSASFISSSEESNCSDSCEENEIWVSCPDTVCVPKTCDDVGFPVPCIDLRPDGQCPSKPGCICKEGFVRNKAGICIPMRHCPSCGGDPNAESGCGTNCNRLCSNYFKKNVSCAQGCFYNACECKKGYVFDEITRKCVLPSQCTPPLKCKMNEVYDPCPANCPSRTCGINDAAVSCMKPLPNGHPDCAPPKCRCKDGFYRNNVGDCVLWKHCPKCNLNEVYDPCPPPCPPQTCDVNVALILCAVPPQLGDPACAPGCRCIDGYVRNKSGVCIPKDQCPKCPRPNEVFDPCIAPCPGRRCDVDPRTIKCAAPPKVGDPLCEAGCRCADGYLRNDEGECIPEYECPQRRCKKNERYEVCPPFLCQPLNCTQVGFPVPCPSVHGQGCPGKPACICKDDYVRNKDGICVPRNQCPSCAGDVNAVAGCGVYCNQRCRDIGKESRGCIEICYENACDCRAGYYLDENTGFCVLPKHCTPQCPENEFYSECTQGNCGPQNCSQLGHPLPCPRIDPKYCKKGCLCRQGYVRNDKGVCIPSTECPPTCGKNEEYNKCTNAYCGPVTCKDVGFPISCIQSVPEHCIKGCQCKSGYVRNDKGICILASECPTCGGDANAIAGCGVYCNQRCRDIGKKPGPCILICNGNACDCRPGYYLDENTGKCVLPKHCTTQCPANEFYSECIQGHCKPQNCSQLDGPISCPRIDPKHCKKGCLCKEGYLRAANGKCIPENECPVSCGGDPNAEPGCGSNCGRHCSNIGKGLVACTLECRIGGCDCKKGYYFDDNIKKCVKPEDCSPVCRDQNNEVYSDCINGGCQAKNCSQYGKPVPCVRPKHCIKGCLCKKGYLRAANGKCIPEKQCSEACNQPHEEYVKCGWDCPPQTCESLDRIYDCPIIDEDDCKPMCRCKPGYYRNLIGQCITEEQCRKCKGPHEFYSCGGACDNVCETIHKQNQTHCPIINIKCNNMCYCEKGYARAKNNTCIPISACKERQCPANERYDECPAALCEPQHCSQLGYPIDCPELDADDACPGKPGCVCVDGYVRNAKGKCIPKRDCPKCGGDANAVAGCGVYCNQRCRDIGKKPGACILICYENACDCREGYYLDEKTGKCVLPKQCTSQCPVNEWFSECIQSHCNPQKCSQLGFPIPCPKVDPSQCKKGCLCKEGYVRNYKGICVPPTECPSCGGDPNAQAGCGVNCNKHCSDIGKEPGFCPALCKYNSCDCKNGYFYDNNTKKCVKPEQCPPICLAVNNEVYSDCINGGCQPKNCSQYGKPVPCVKIDPKYCIKGCLCKEGYLRADNGRCIPKEHCPKVCKGRNEEYHKCAWNCPPQTCESLYKAYSCPLQNEHNCKPMCKCKPGFYRNLIGQCITEKQCRKCKGPHEFYSCGGACDNVCETIHQQNQTHCPIINIKCNNMCYCERGYARAKNNTCIPIRDCNKPQCPINERYEKCPARLCEPQTCSQLGYPIDCAEPATDGPCPGKPGCVCVDGYVRNAKGKCIPKRECPKCGGDANAVAGCGVYCNQRCRDIGKEPGGCILICYENACDCREGYYRDENTGKCVLPKQCTPTCLAARNEVYSDCINGGCQAKNCSQYGKPVPCVKIDPKYCIKGCLCKEGYLRDDNGRCIPEKDCPTSCGGDPNAIPGCGSNCGRHCSDIGQGPVACTLECKLGGCECKKGYFYDDNVRKCVKPGDCTPVCRAQNNEVYSDCINGGCQAKNCSQYGKPVPCIKINAKDCIKGCLCKKGYLRAANGKCIPEKKCPEACNGRNEEYHECGWDCPPQTCKSLDRAYACPLLPGNDCKPMCKCKPGFFRNLIGQCITEKQCRKCKGPHEFYSCGGACDNVCETIHQQNQTHCPIINIKCNNMCYCERGYARAKNNTCIPIRSCNEPQCPINERYEKCPATLCEPQHCSQLGYPIDCPKPPAGGRCPGKPGCVCNDGYVRNANGKCIPKTKCPSCGGDDNAQSGCGVNCGKHCRDIGKDGVPCIKICYLNACDCKDGYYLNEKTGKCVLPKQCPPQCGKNEFYSDCIQGNCSPQNCTQLGFPIPCPRIDPKYCKKGCLCKEGYVRNHKGICIPSKECSSCGGDPNAQAGCGGNCNRRCSDIGKKPGACTLSCEINGCDCKDGYYLNEKTGKCVLPKQCPPQCGKNEFYSDCIQGNCSPQNCTQLGFPIPCPRIDPKYCKKGCLCKEGYVRNHKGICIPSKECSSCGGDPNAQAGCGGNCNRRCSDIGKKPGACTLSCEINGCDCKDGYYLNEKTGKCVLPKQCPPQCPINERYEKCPATLCEPQNCSQLGYPINCAEPAADGYCPGKPGCVCDYGYVRNAKGKCIPKRECPSCGGDNNAHSGCGVNCGKHCRDIGKDGVPCIKICYPNACDCKDGYYLNDKTGKCVLPKQCPKQCPANEWYSHCIQRHCNPQKCSQLGFPIPCPKIDSNHCKEGCLCNEGYVRNRDGICVHPKECPSCGGDPNAQAGCGLYCNRHCSDIGKKPGACPAVCKYNSCDCKDGYYYDVNTKRCVRPKNCSTILQTLAFSCGGACDNVCSSLNEQNQTNCPIINIKCNEMCYCEKNYARDENNICVPISSCKVSCGGDPNAKPGCGINCGKRCPNNYINPKLCPRIACKPTKCDCKDGFYYDINIKKCVKLEDCSPKCGDDEIYTPCVNGGCEMKNCSQLGGPQLCIDPIKCLGGCICKEGYLRLKNGTCVPYNQCPTPKCNKNERFEICPAKLCQPQSCREIGFPIDCPAPDDKCPGYPACVCDYGYVRNNKGICRPKIECPSCGGDPNAQSGCGVNCGKRCPNNNLNPKLCPRICLPNACDCKDGFLFDINVKKCVIPKHCSPRCDNLNNEVYDSCVNGGCGWRNCSQVGGPIICIDPLKCYQGCKCKEGYYRLENGTCVPENKCPLNCWKPHEVYDPCPQICPPQTCESIGKKFFCPRQNATGCKGQCRCKRNFYRNKIGECIHEKDCLKCTGQNEYFSCGPACDDVCGKLETESKKNCPIKNIKCVPKCYCEDGFARNATGICIPVSECPVKCSGPNEYFACGPACDNVCAKLETESKDDCPIKNKKCVLKCYCEDGYARNEKGICIPICDCPDYTTPTTTKPRPPVNATVALANFDEGNRVLAAEFIKQLLVTRPGENFMISGLSVMMALAPLTLCSKGEVYEQLIHMMNLKNKDEIRTIFPILIQNYKSQKDVIFEVANKLYINIEYQFATEFLNATRITFSSETEGVDFSRNVEAADIINDWVEDQTNGLINNLVDADMFNADTRCVLVNALYFLGNWDKPFNKNDTTLRDFHIDNDRTTSIKTMHQQGRFPYAESDDLDCKIIRLNYKGSKFSLLIFLPNEITGLPDLVEKIRIPGNYAKAVQSLTDKTVKIYLPPFDVETNISDLPYLLKKVNVTELFKPKSDGLEGILQNHVPLYVSDAIQKTKIKVDETGTEAAAATAVLMTRSLARPASENYVFNANHPFAFFLTLDNSIIFEGCIVH